MSCNCEICTESRDIRDMIFRKDVDKLIEKVEDLHNRFMNSDEDYLNCILDGEWPNSVMILEAALKRAKEYEAKKS